MNLLPLGWSDFWDPHIQKDEKVVRITAVHRGQFRASDNQTDYNGYLSGKLQHSSTIAAELPAVGDWCISSPPFIDEQDLPAVLIEKILPRKTKISRVAAGNVSDEQIIAANIDHAFIVTSANKDFNLNRLQRYFLLADEGSVEAVIILSKVDLYPKYQSLMEKVKETFPQTTLVCTSIESSIGLTELHSLLKTGSTSVFVGSSGVGKSTLVNHLLGRQRQLTKTIREDDDKGRHATSARELFFIPDGGMIIDTPGLRELRVFGSGEGIKSTFKTIDGLSKKCKFSNCSHTTEPDCAVQAAVEKGEMDSKEMENYQKLLREIEYENTKLDKRLASNQKRKWKSRSIDIKNMKKIEGK